MWRCSEICKSLSAVIFLEAHEPIARTRRSGASQHGGEADFNGFLRTLLCRVILQHSLDMPMAGGASAPRAANLGDAAHRSEIVFGNRGPNFIPFHTQAVA